MNKNIHRYEGFYTLKSFNNQDVNITLLNLLRNDIIFSKHSQLENFKIYEHNCLSREWFQYVEGLDLDNDFIMLQNEMEESFAMGRSIWGYDILNFNFLILRNFPDNEVIINRNVNMAFLMNYGYKFLQSEDNPQTYDFYKVKYDKSKLYFNEDFQMELLDISQNIGRKRDLGDFYFYPAYKIWFGKEAQVLFGKEKIVNFKEAIYIKELPNGVIEMQLMDDITKPHLPYNQEKQQKIIEYLDIDKLEIKRN